MAISIRSLRIKRIPLAALCVAGFATISILAYWMIVRKSEHIIRPGDPIYETLKRYEKSGTGRPVYFSEWREVKSDSLSHLFPNLRFAAVSWSEELSPYPEGLSVPPGISGTVAIDKSRPDEIAAMIFPHGEFLEFGELLKKSSVRIEKGSDAEEIGRALCEIRGEQRQMMEAQKISPTVWHLETGERNGVRYYIKIILNESYQVQSARMESADSWKEALKKAEN